MRPTRYAHFTQGHTDICYSADGRYVLTCGSDGEVRVFEGLDDDDCKTHVVAECASAIAFRDGRFLVGTDSNLVQAYTLEEGAPDGIITRFTAPATHIVVSKDGKTVACASSDMNIVVHDTSSYKDMKLSGHKAPVLSVALDPKGEYLASSSCDGSVCVWDLATSSRLESWSLLPKSNCFSSSSTLCRLTWTPDGTRLVVPVESSVHLYDRTTRKLIHKLTDDAVKQTVSITTTSPCGGFIAGACTDGTIVVWNALTYRRVMLEKHPKSLSICGLAWHPAGKKELAFVDVGGQFGTTDVSLQQSEPLPSEDSTGYKENPAGIGPDAGSGDLLPPLAHSDTMDADDDEDTEFSIAKIKNSLGFADDEEGTFMGLPSGPQHPPGVSVVGEESVASRVVTPVPQYRLPEVQKPFQPSMSPDHLTDRYMVWNNVGIVRQYNSEEDNNIDVEFHDTAVHHALHFNNNAGHTMAALSAQALALACEAQDDLPSKVVVQHFGGWGSNKEWSVSLGEGEEAVAVCVGVGWVAVATDTRKLRVFSTSGTQRDVLMVPGPVVCLAGFEDQLMVVFHDGLGVSGDQHMGMLVLNVGGGRHRVAVPCPVALSPHSFLAWAGFSDEGSPVIMDSAGLVSLMHRKFGCSWIPVLDTKTHTRGKSDHYFLLGLSEIQGSVRCVLCKGSRYPPVLPKPHVSLLNIKMPLCELESEKGELEERSLQTGLLLSTLTSLSSLGYDVDEPRQQADKILKESMIKLFALACRGERESRAVEVCQLMPSYQTVELAIKYASKLHRLQLAERLGEVAEAKMNEELQPKPEEDVHSGYDMNGSTRCSVRRVRSSGVEEYESDHHYSSTTAQEEEEQQEEEEGNNHTRENPFLVGVSSRDHSTSLSLSLSGSSTKNPFKKSATPNSETRGSKKGIDVIDQFRKAMKKSSPSVLRPVMKKSQTKQAAVKKKVGGEQLVSSGKENKLDVSLSTPDSGEAESPPAFEVPVVKSTPMKQQSAFHLWLQDNEEEVKARNPEAEESQLLARAALMFKDVDMEIKQKYRSLATGTTTQNLVSKKSEEEGKRQLEEGSDEVPAHKKAKGSAISKLSAFAFARASGQDS